MVSMAAIIHSLVSLIVYLLYYYLRQLLKGFIGEVALHIRYYNHKA